MATVNPYLGSDGVKPFLEVCGRCDKGIFVLVKTSNPSSGELQDRLIDGEPLYARVADLTSSWGASLMEGEWSNVGAVSVRLTRRCFRSSERVCRTPSS